MKLASPIFLIFLLSCQFNREDAYLKRISQLPPFKVLSVDSTSIFDPSMTRQDKPILIIYFGPDCPHCKAETRDILKDETISTNFQIFFITSAPLSDAKTYSQLFGLDNHRNVFVGKDYKHEFKNLFQPSVISFMAIYNEKKQLVKIYTGETSTNSIVDASRL